MSIILASKSQLKVSAVRSVLGENVNIQALEPTDCSRVEQPVGYDAARICAKSRIAGVVPNVEYNSIKWIIAIENYIDCDGEEWWDAPMIIIADGQGKTLSESPLWGPDASCSVWIPTGVIDRTRDVSDVSQLGWNKTVGQAIHEVNPQFPANNWQKCYGDIDRCEQMTRALITTIQLVEIRRLLTAGFSLYEDYPKPGVLFRDMNSILANTELFSELIKLIAMWVPHTATHIAGMESRGFILGAALAFNLKLPFVPIRKQGKLPGKVYRTEYVKEYGIDALEVQEEILPKGSQVVLVDDVLATGGTARAAVELVGMCGATVERLIVVDQVPELSDRAAERMAGVPFTVIL